MSALAEEVATLSIKVMHVSADGLWPSHSLSGPLALSRNLQLSSYKQGHKPTVDDGTRIGRYGKDKTYMKTQGNAIVMQFTNESCHTVVSLAK